MVEGAISGKLTVSHPREAGKYSDLSVDYRSVWSHEESGSTLVNSGEKPAITVYMGTADRGKQEMESGGKFRHFRRKMTASTPMLVKCF